MSEWEEIALGDLVTVRHGFAFKSQFFSDSGPDCLVTPGNFLERGGFRSRGVRQKRYAGPVDEKYVLAPGAVVVAMTEQGPGLLGSAGVVPESGERWLHNQRIGLISAKQHPTDARYVGYALNTALVRQQINATATGTKVRHTAPARIEAVRIPVPDLATRSRIMHFLAAFDEIIEINERRISVLEKLARSLYREWFVHFRFPGHEDRNHAPKDWERGTISDIATVNPRTLKASQLPGRISYLDISAVGIGTVVFGEQIEAANAPGRARREILHGDTVWSTVRPNRRAHALIVAPPGSAIGSTGLAVIRPKTVPASFLYAVCDDSQFSDWLVGRATGSAYPAVRPADFEEAPVTLPGSALLDLYDKIASPALVEASTLHAQSARLAAIRDLLLPRLVTGRLDISEIDLGDLLDEAQAA